MKTKKFFVGISLLLLSSFSFQSCIGSFALTNKVLAWNQNVSNKFVNELVFFAFWILPVYEVTAAADLLVINSIEFWSGNIPLEAHNKTIKTDEGDYLISVNENGYKIMSPNGEALNFIFDADSRTWSFCKNDNAAIDFLKFKDESHVQFLDNQGEFVDVELSAEGINDYKTTIGLNLMAMN